MSDTPGSSWPVPYPVQLIILAFLYVVTGWLGLGLASHQENVTLIWPPTGLSLAVLILFGRRLWPGVLLGSLVLNMIQGMPPLAGAAVSFGNTLEAFVTAYVMLDRLDFRPSLARVRDVGVLIAFGGAAATLISATFGATSLWLAGIFQTSDLLTVFMIWWRGDFGGVVAVTPFLLLLRTGAPAWSILIRQNEFWIVTIFLLVSCGLAFSGAVVGETQRLAAYLPFPCLAWAGVRLGTRGAVLMGFTAVGISTLATAGGVGPFVMSDPRLSVTALWAYGVALGSTALILAAAIAQRDTAEARHARELAEQQRIEKELLLAKERERIMRDMHDSLGGHLVSVLSMVQRGNADANEVAETLRRSLDDMRIMIDSLDTSQIGLQEMLGKLRARLEPMMKRNGLQLRWRVDELGPLDGFEPERSLHVLRIIQEAVANVIQHAQATEVEIEISLADAETISIEIRDNGVGLVPHETTGGRGVINMKARAFALGAELRLESAERGRRILLLAPVLAPVTAPSST